jgi:hypothetical protein
MITLKLPVGCVHEVSCKENVVCALCCWEGVRAWPAQRERRCSRDYRMAPPPLATLPSQSTTITMALHLMQMSGRRFGVRVLA